MTIERLGATAMKIKTAVVIAGMCLLALAAGAALATCS